MGEVKPSHFEDFTFCKACGVPFHFEDFTA